MVYVLNVENIVNIVIILNNMTVIKASELMKIAREKGNLGNLYQSAQALVETTNKNIDHARATNAAYVNALRLIRIEPKNDEDKKIVDKAQQTITDFDTEQAKRLVGPMARVEALGRELGMPTPAAPARTDMPTSMTRADVEATAKASRKSVQEVEAMAKARGITIN